MAVFDLEDDWQPLHSFQDIVLTSGNFQPDVGHAFVEVVHSDSSTIGQELKDPRGSGGASTASAAQPPLDKGTSRQEAPAPSRGTSTQSVVDDDLPEKHEIHVMDHSGTSYDGPLEEAPSQPIYAFPLEDDPTDPPLPDLSNVDPSITLTQDIASLLSAFNGVVNSSPELVTSLRRIFDNARRGTYWEAHREALSLTVNELSESVGATTEDFRRNAEAEAARRISESVGGLLRTLSVEERPAAAGSFVNPASSQPPNASVPGASSSGTGQTLSTSAPPGAGNESASAPASGGLPYPSAPPKGPPRFSGTRRSGGQASVHDIWSPSARPSWLPAPPPIQPQPSQSSDDSQHKASPQELRASVEAAKAQYKVEKERYRKEREERKRLREERKVSGSGSDAAKKAQTRPSDGEEHTSPASGEQSTAQLVSNARGPFPRLEMISVVPPQRHPSRSSSSTDAHQRSYNHIVKKLADMGFTLSSHPEIAAKVKARLPNNVPLSKEEEDSIATIVLKDLLATTATRNASPSTSGAHGVWH